MNSRPFLFQLAGLTFFLALASFGLHEILSIQQYQGLTWFSLLFYVVLSLLMFFLGKKASLNKNHGLFTSLSLLLTVGKLLISVLIVVAYSKMVNPVGKAFVIPFFLIYICFTIFETYFMMKLAKVKQPGAKSKKK